MAWRQYTYELTEANRERVEDALLAAGACAVTLQAQTDEPIFEVEPSDRPLWNAIKLTALIDVSLDHDAFLLNVNAALGETINPCHSELLADKDWTREWMTHFKPIQCGQRLWIVPSWHTPPQATAVNLILDPGLAFGSGTHPTTKMCLQWLDANVSSGNTVIDYGCGSGILAIASLLLGAQHALACDIDPQAIIATNDNAERNRIADGQLSSLICEAVEPETNADIVIANILANPLIGLSDTLGTMLKSRSQLVLSGILENQADAVIAAYRPYLTLDVTNSDDGWVLLSGTAS